MKYHIVDPDIKKISEKREMQPLSLKVLSNMNLSEEQFDNLFFPVEVFPACENMDRIRERLLKAAQRGEKVFVFGDYDADGVCSTTLMVRLLQRLKIDVGYYIPNRLKEGYGLSTDKVLLAIEKGYQLIVTVDNGVAAFEALRAARERGVEVIVTDHHNIPDGYDYDYLLHPTVFDDPAFRNMCGAGVVLQLIRSFAMDDEKDWILAMVATIGDMMPLFFENRNIVKKGLDLLNRKGFKPIQYLSKKEVFDESVIAFDVVPAINTLGRLADRANVNNLVRYFLAEEETGMIHMADQIVALNKERQQLVKEARRITPSESYALPNYDIYVSSEYHEGIAGLLANAYLNENHKPALVLVENEEGLKGSGRSPAGFNIFEDLNRYRELFSAFGGHNQACGLSLAKEKLPVLIDALRSEEKAEVSEEKETAVKLEISDLSLRAVEELMSLKPFGEGFKLPLFYIPAIHQNYVSLIKGMYKKGSTFQNGEAIESICFQTSVVKKLESNDWNELIFTLGINEFKGKKTVSLNIKDVVEMD